MLQIQHQTQYINNLEKDESRALDFLAGELEKLAESIVNTICNFEKMTLKQRDLSILFKPYALSLYTISEALNYLSKNAAKSKTDNG